MGTSQCLPVMNPIADNGAATTSPIATGPKSTMKETRARRSSGTKESAARRAFSSMLHRGTSQIEIPTRMNQT